MRVFSDAVTYLIESGNIAVIYLVTIITPFETLRDTTASYDVTFDGQLYSAGNGLMIVEGPRQSSAVDRETYKVTYVDPEFNKRDLFEKTLTGSSVETRLVFVNTRDIAWGTTPVAPGALLLDPLDTTIAYKGVADTQGYAVSPEDGTAIAVVECSSPMASLSLVKPFFTSRDAMRQQNPIDTSFDQVSINSIKVTHLWGKA